MFIYDIEVREIVIPNDCLPFCNHKSEMNMQKIEYKKAELLGIIKTVMKELEDKCEDIDSGYFNESDIDSYYNYLLSKYKNEIVVVDDTGEGGDYEGAF